MSNTLLTPQVIAREMALRLAGALNFGGLVYKNYSEEFQRIGDTVTVRKPATFEAKDFVTTTSTQDIVEDSVAVKLDKLADITVEVGSKELSLDIVSFGEQFIDGAVLAMRDKIDKSIAALYKEVPYYSGTAGGTTPSTLKTGFTEPRKILNVNKAPMSNRAVVFDPTAEAELLNLDAIVNADKSASDKALREGYMGRIMGMDTFMNQNVATHVAGAYSALADVTVTTAVAGASTLTLTSAAGASTAKLLQGDCFTVDGKQYTVTADTAAAVAGVVTVSVFPKVHANLASFVAVTVSFAKTHVANMAFHKNAFALVTRPLEAPMGGAESYTMTVDGISVRVTMGYNMSTKKNTVSMDCLFGVKAIQPELAVRILG